MKPRITLITVVTLALSLGAVATASAQDTATQDAAAAQYQSEQTSAVPVVPQQPPTQGSETSTDQPATPPERPSSNVDKTTDSTTPVAVPSTETQQPPVVEAGSGSLPYTGYAATTVAILGVALLGAGLVLRHQTRRGLQR